MNCSIQEVEAFSIIGQETELTNFQRRNIQISTQFWQKSNASLKKAYLSQSGNWIKYAFTERQNGKLLYYCAIPNKTVVPENFILKEIKPRRYLVVEHTGSMDKIYGTYRKIYKEMPNNQYLPMQGAFLHFEKYDYRFHWNKENSIIEVWIPLQS